MARELLERQQEQPPLFLKRRARLDCHQQARWASLVIMESDSDSLRLPDGLYPFADQRLPLADMAMMEAPRELEDLLREAAAAEGVTIIRDRPVELRCKSASYPDAVFLVFWPSGAERLNVLAPRSAVRGRA